MNLLDLIEADGFTFKRVATTNGGEYAGPCPFCGGTDRFRVWPESGRYWCRGCDKRGDSIQYLRDYRELSFEDSCRYLGHEPTRPRKTPDTWKPRESPAATDAWQKEARSFLDRAIETLWSPQGETIRAWLHAEKGLQDETIRAAGLGLNPVDKYSLRKAWGLSEGERPSLWLPSGIVIPFFAGQAITRLRIRRDEGEPRYVIVSGSSMAPMAWSLERAAVVVVESELDGLLLNQEAGDLCGVVALGNAQAQPNKQTHDLLTRAEVILISLDADDAGARASWQFWPKTYGNKAKRWPTVNGKDPSEAWKNGLNLRDWLIAGVFQTEEKFERFCIQTIDGGLSDAEALKAMKIRG